MSSHDEPDGPDGTSEGMPRWVRVMAIIAAVGIAILLILQYVGGEHSPGRHVGLAVEAPARNS